MHDDDIPIDDALVRALVDLRLPEHAGLPLTRLVAAGSSNVVYRLGGELLVRLPRRPGGGASIDIEHRWTERLGRGVHVEVPRLVAVAEPALGYPERWAVLQWLAGSHPGVVVADAGPDSGRTQLAEDLAAFVAQLRDQPVPVDGAPRPYRGRSLREQDARTRQDIERCRRLEGLDLDLDAALATWTHALTLPGADGAAPDRWLHGDLVSENLLVTDGRLTAVLDFGGVGVGDPTVDLHGAWELFDAGARDTFRAAVGADEATWLRGRAWALAIALMTFPYYWTTMTRRVAERRVMAANVLADAAGRQLSRRG